MMQSVTSLVNNAKQKVVAVQNAVTNRMYTLVNTQRGAISIETVALIIVGIALIVFFFPQAKDLITTGFTKAKGWMDQIL
ncbi:hypothetical protein [Paenibacillus hunanensis]|uniref:Flagellin Flp1-like domain-containing protein n=1 Tax=Paenibacillus hunanensis TaxID=539262 RepID=A0ABU1IYM1_9BACL|nr:hypothetical protein [Paenibacillus hunanensis]MDR6243462.1 hypothetical protein [Paenibacillus hunanensis]GGI97942.1 hypothetical protein GCM10008022_03250 [Paenibacillus hunanensis]